MERVRDAFLVLLRAGLWGKFPENRGLFPLEEEEWERVFAMSRRQSVSGMVFDGICLLPETLQPSPAAFAKWIVIADAIEKFSGRMNAALKELTVLFVSEGLRPVLQKGQGVAALYPEPSHRECGDIDFYFPERQPLRQAPRPGKESPLPVADPAKVTGETMDDKAVELVRRHGVTVTRMPDGSQTYEWHGIDVEHHSAIIDLRSPAAIRLSGELDETREFVPTDIADGLRVPSPALNALMLTDYVNIAQNGFTGATPPTSANIMTTTGTNPMFECLSRNRDLNGDGKIDEDEVRWYLPSVRQCIFAWCGKKSLPTEISFETTNYATSTNLGFRIWWALEGTAISSWANMETNPMIRCVRNLGTNSTSGEVSDITSWDQENYVVTVNGLKDETLRTNMQIGEYPEHENFDAASTLPKAFKIASADLNIPASGEDTYAPAITVGELNPTGIPESQSNTTPHNITVPVTITNYDASKNYTYQIGAGNEVNVTLAEFNVSVTINHTSTSNGTTSSKTIKIKSDNGNYTSFNVTVTLTTRTEGFIFQTKYYTYTYSKSTPQQTIVTGGTPAKNTFKYTEIMNGDWCEKYYQEGTDDLGKWRIPNEKELYFIQRYCGEEITGNLAGYPSSGTQTGTMRYAAKTKYNRNLIHDPSNPGNTFMIYYLQKDGSSGTPIVTTGHGQSGADFTIRCVRDAPQGTRSYDSSYSSGGTGFGL